MIRLVNDRALGIEVGRAALIHRIDMAESAFDSFDVKTFVDGDTPVGMLMTKHVELHVAILPRYRRRWLSRRLIDEVLGGIIKQYGYAMTKVMADNQVGQAFVERLGFIKQAETNGVIFYRTKP